VCILCMREDCVIRRVRETWGHLGNMAPYPLLLEDVEWRTSEHAFQALRCPRGPVWDLINAEKSPMAAKMVAKAHADLRVVIPMSPEDLVLMERVLRAKLAQHVNIRELLRETGDRHIVEDCTSRPHGTGLFWGARRTDQGWEGKNWLGVKWMEIRNGNNP